VVGKNVNNINIAAQTSKFASPKAQKF